MDQLAYKTNIKFINFGTLITGKLYSDVIEDEIQKVANNDTLTEAEKQKQIADITQNIMFNEAVEGSVIPIVRAPNSGKQSDPSNAGDGGVAGGISF